MKETTHLFPPESVKDSDVNTFLASPHTIICRYFSEPDESARVLDGGAAIRPRARVHQAVCINELTSLQY